MKIIIKALCLSLLMLMFAGCSGKNIIMPGQENSDCDVSEENNGVCGNPMNLYKFRDKVAQIVPKDGVVYSIDDKGEIKDKKTGEIIIPGSLNSSDRRADTVSLRRKSLTLPTPDNSIAIMDMGVIRKIWIAPYEGADGSWNGARYVNIVVEKPRWVIGENAPKKLDRSALVPSLLTEDVVKQNMSSPSYKDKEIIKNYIGEKENE